MQKELSDEVRKYLSKQGTKGGKKVASLYDMRDIGKRGGYWAQKRNLGKKPKKK